MLLALHALTTRHCNCLTEVRLARDLHYQGIEFMVAKLLRYMDQAGQATTPDDVARLDKNLIYGVHICDGKRRVPGTLWDEGALRGYLPGEGDIPIAEWVAAVKATGFDGVWSAETYSPRHWEADLF